MWDPIIEGCTTSTACNYNPEAKKDDNSCIDPLGCNNWCPGDTTEVKGLDCADVCGGMKFIDCTGECGILVIDECGTCGGNNTICKDCNGIVNGEAELDKCGNCVGGDTGLEACTYDCLGYWGGSAELDVCGVCDGIDNYVSGTCNDCAGIPNGTAYTDGCGDCVGGNTGLEECDYDCAGTLGGEAELDQCDVCNGDNSTCKDCHGDINGTAYTDGCGECAGGNTGLTACTTDCADVFGGKSFYDDCGVCVPQGDTTCIQGCDGIWKNDGSQLVLDECEVCGGNNSSCIDCAGTPNGSAILDNCEECVTAGDTSCVQGCDGFWDNEGNQIVLDECNICGGDNTVCVGCDGIPNSGLEIDVCGVCGGNDTCLPENCTDDNVSGFCQDLSVLQILIDNNLETLNMNMDINENEVIEPLELGNQNWLDGRLISLQCKWQVGNYPDWETINCQLSGEIPSEIGNLTSLTTLALNRNELTGEIPSEIGNLTSLTILYLHNNELTGEIPSEIGNLTNLTELRLEDNKLTGEIPLEIGNLLSLIGLILLENQLTGEIPLEIGNLTNLTHLALSSNQLTGEIPVEIGNLTNLTYFLLSSNQLSGEIPAEIGNLTNLTTLFLDNNELTGEIPEEICNQGDSSPYLTNNQLCPPYPSCIGDYFIGEQDISECPVHPLVGEWLGAEREHYSVNQGDTSSVMVDSTNVSWTFKEDFTFTGWTEQSIQNPVDTLYYSGIWSVFQNQLTLTFVIDEETEISIFDYIINNNNLELTDKIYPLENDSGFFEITILRMWKSN